MALNDPNVAAMAAAALDPAVEDLSIKEDYQGTWPGRYVIRIVDVKEVNVVVNGQIVSELHASFRNSDLSVTIPGGGMDAVLSQLAQALGPDNFSTIPGATVTTSYSPLSLQIKDSPAYVIFVLGAPSNIRFSPTKKALTHKNPDDRDRYGRLRHVIPSGTTSFREEEDALDDCRIAYFVANPPGPGPSLTQQDYQHGFDFNVRLRQNVPNEEPRGLEIKIDPDIRYPGGSGT
jgi:hypothetical protein